MRYAQATPTPLPRIYALTNLAAAIAEIALILMGSKSRQKFSLR